MELLLKGLFHVYEAFPCYLVPREGGAKVATSWLWCVLLQCRATP